MVWLARAGRLARKPANNARGRDGIGAREFFLVSPVAGFDFRCLRLYSAVTSFRLTFIFFA